MRAVLVLVNASPIVIELPDVEAAAFREMQAIVGGWLECVPFSLQGKRVDVYCDEDGLSKKLPKNRKGIVGTFVVLGRSRNKMIKLTQEQATAALRVFVKEEGSL